MNRVIIFIGLGVLVLLGCGSTGAAFNTAAGSSDDLARLAAQYADDVARQSQTVDDLVSDIAILRVNAARAIQQDDLASASKLLSQVDDKADEIRTIQRNLQNRKPQNVTLSDETVAILNRIKLDSEVAALVRQEQSILSGTTGSIERAFNWKLSPDEKEWLKISLNELFCLNMEKLASENRFASQEEYAVYFIQRWAFKYQPNEIVTIYNATSSIMDYADQLQKGTSQAEIMRMQQLNSYCSSLSK
jgi:predicted RNA-binding protein with PIN domain